MLTDPVEIDIISRARAANVRDPKRSRDHFNRIFADFLSCVRFEESQVLDLGPGQWDFGVLAAELGAEVWGVDNDPAVIELGQHKGFKAVQGELRHPSKLDLPVRFDGLFCKYSINAFWVAKSEAEQRRFVSDLLGLARPDAWIWIAPWNGAPKAVTPETLESLMWQKAAFEAHGCRWQELTEDETVYYGVHGNTANRIVFTRGL